jgi:hypothetical protein
MKSCEQEARDILERMGIDGAQEMTAGDLVELGNVIAENRRLAMLKHPIGIGVCDGCGRDGIRLFACDGAPLAGGAICVNCIIISLETTKKETL